MTQKFIKNRSITKDGELVRETTAEFYSPFKEGVGYNFKYKSTFIKSYLGISLPIGENGFSDLELGRMYRISKMMYSDSNLLARRVDMDIVPLCRDDIQSSLDMHRTKFVPFWKKLSDFKIIKTVPLDGKTFYCMNPLYFNTTTYMPLYLYIAFKQELQEHVPKWAIEKYLEMDLVSSIKPDADEESDPEQ